MHARFYPLENSLFEIRRSNVRLLAVDLRSVRDTYTNFSDIIGQPHAPRSRANYPLTYSLAPLPESR